MSKSQSCAVSVEVVMAYLPEPLTEMEDTEESCPLIQLTSSLVSAGVDGKIKKEIKDMKVKVQ